MNVLVTGTSHGIGRAIAYYFLKFGYNVCGIDIDKSSIEHHNYLHYVCDVADRNAVNNLTCIPTINILINNAGVQNSGRDIEVNLKGTINVTEKFGIQPSIKSILNIASASAHTGAEFPEYSASKGGMLAYTKNVALRVAKYGATCNSLSPGGVLTDLNSCVIEDDTMWSQIMELTPLKRWSTAEEMAEWSYFLTVVNKFATAQDFLVDGGESSNMKFIWKGGE